MHKRTYSQKQVAHVYQENNDVGIVDMITSKFKICMDQAAILLKYASQLLV